MFEGEFKKGLAVILSRFKVVCWQDIMSYLVKNQYCFLRKEISMVIFINKWPNLNSTFVEDSANNLKCQGAE